MSNPENRPVDPNEGQLHPSVRPNELQSFESRLARLAPRDDRLDRVRLAFLAGQASRFATETSPSSRSWLRHPVWPAAFAGMSTLAATFLVILLVRPGTTDSSQLNSRSLASTDRSEVTPKSVGTKTFDRGTDTLSPRLALDDDFEIKLANPVAFTVGLPKTPERSGRPAPTPTMWKEFSDGPSTTNPPSDSSIPRMNQGIQT
jgi:hypothetical protein